MVSRPADTAFHDIADTELLRDFFEIARDAALVLHHRSATDHFQVLDLGKVRQQFILDAVGKESVLLFFAQIFQRQHGDAFVRNWEGRTAGRRLAVERASLFWDGILPDAAGMCSYLKHQETCCDYDEDQNRCADQCPFWNRRLWTRFLRCPAS